MNISHTVLVMYPRILLRNILRIRDSQTDSKESLFPLIFMNSEELRNLYANLLAKSMYIDTKELVHPSFVEIIRQMSPIDALIFKTIMGRAVNPMINLIMKNEKGTFRTIVTNVTDINIAPQVQTAAERTRSNGTFGTGATESTTVPKVHPYQYHFFS